VFWKRHSPDWLIDPRRVAFGSVVEDNGRDLSRSHVRVKYRYDPAMRFVPLVAFFLSCRDHVRDGRSLAIEHLLVAPIIRQRHADFFDRLTDWGPATRRALRRPPRMQRRLSIDT